MIYEMIHLLRNMVLNLMALVHFLPHMLQPENLFLYENEANKGIMSPEMTKNGESTKRQDIEAYIRNFHLCSMKKNPGLAI